MALFSALAIAVHTFEALLPSPLPWLRPGLANILTLCALLLFGGRAAWLVAITRICLGSFLLGTLFSPAFFLSLAGGLVGTGFMITARAVAGSRFGPVGISVSGATGHVLGQLAMAGLLLRHAGLWHLLPPLLLLALASGTFNGIVAALLLERLRRRFAQTGDVA